jgi:hypothetical protein
MASRVLACVVDWLAAGRPLSDGVAECREHTDLVGVLACTHRRDPLVAARLQIALAWGARAFAEAASRAALRTERAFHSRLGMQQDAEILNLRAEADAQRLRGDVLEALCREALVAVPGVSEEALDAIEQ